MSGLTMSDIHAIMALIDGSNFRSIKLEMGDLKLELNRDGAGSTAQVPVPPKNEKPLQATRSDSNDTPVPAPLLGTFYHAGKPGAAPFVKLGDTVTAETVIGIIEVMKLMNTVTAGIAGVVTEIAAANGVLVEHGQALIRVRQA